MPPNSYLVAPKFVFDVVPARKVRCQLVVHVPTTTTVVKAKLKPNFLVTKKGGRGNSLSAKMERAPLLVGEPAASGDGGSRLRTGLRAAAALAVPALVGGAGWVATSRGAAARTSVSAPALAAAGDLQQQRCATSGAASLLRDYGDGPIGKAMTAWENDVFRAGGVTPHDLTVHVRELESVWLPKARVSRVTPHTSISSVRPI